MNLDPFLERHGLPQAFRATANAFYMPLARWVDKRLAEQPLRTTVLGISGAQGTGKSTLAAFLGDVLGERHRVATLSIDDLYLTRSEREALARTVHPLLRTRGVPGTHDTELGMRILDALSRLGHGERLALPRFDKSVDDRRPASEWPEVEGPVDLVIFEGWCVGSSAVHPDALEEPVNRLEAEEDADGTWRRYANQKLETTYKILFNYMHYIVFLQAPSVTAIHRWRLEQEQKLAAVSDPTTPGILDEAAIIRFIQHFERITRDSLATLPTRADVVLTLDENHGITAAGYRTP